MEVRPRVSLQSPRYENLSKAQQVFLDKLRVRLERAGLSIAPDSRPSAGIEERLQKMRACDGVLVAGFSQWEARRLSRARDKTLTLPSEFTHISIVLAIASRRPFLVLREKALAERGALRRGYVQPVVSLPSSLDPKWLEEAEFEHELSDWLERVEAGRHVFLGYSSQASEVGSLLQKFLAQKLKVRVLDWHDFRPGDSIWDSIERAERLTQCGVFLFMADDRVTVGKERQGVPRDNVVYEAGYFAGAKGRAKSLIIREEGARVPTDLGGILYLALKNRTSIAPLETRLREHLGRMLERAI